VASLLKNIRRQGFDIAIYPTYSREIIGDYLIAASALPRKSDLTVITEYHSP